MTRRVSFTPPRTVGTYVQNGTRYAAHIDVMRMAADIAERDCELLERLAKI